MSTTTDELIDIIAEISDDVQTERLLQFEQWGQQDYNGTWSEPNRVKYAKEADRWRQMNSARVAEGSLTWDGLLLEEAFEAVSESIPSRRRAELVQVAALCFAEIQNIDERAFIDDDEVPA